MSDVSDILTVAHDPAALDMTWDDSHAGAMALLPRGPVWPRDSDGVLSRTVRGLVGNHWRAWRRVRDLLNEADPRTCYETIRMWEIDCGLPDPCVDPPPNTIEGRRAAIVSRRQEGGVTTPMQFIALAATLGYDIEITEFRPFRVWSNCNDHLNPDGVGWAHTWMVNITNAERAIHYFRATSPCNEFLYSLTQGDLECLFERIKPAHTQIIWAYGGAQPPPISYWDRNIPPGSVWDDAGSIWDGQPVP